MISSEKTEYCPVWTDKCYEISNTVSDSISTLLDIADVGIHALNTECMKPGNSVLVIGCRPLGFSILVCSLYWGTVLRFAIEPNIKARRSISEMGVKAFTGLEKDLDKKILDATKEQCVNSVFDTVGDRETQALGRKVLASGGVMVNLAIHHEELRFFMDEISRERIIRSSCNYLFPEFKMAIDLASSGKIDFGSFITHELPLTKAPEAFMVALDKNKSGALKVVLKI